MHPGRGEANCASRWENFRRLLPTQPDAGRRDGEVGSATGSHAVAERRAAASPAEWAADAALDGEAGGAGLSRGYVAAASHVSVFHNSGKEDRVQHEENLQEVG